MPRVQTPITDSEDWSQVTDPELRKRLQNRLSQRRHRAKVRKQLAERNASASPQLSGTECTDDDLPGFSTSPSPSFALPTSESRGYFTPADEGPNPFDPSTFSTDFSSFENAQFGSYSDLPSASSDMPIFDLNHASPWPDSLGGISSLDRTWNSSYMLSPTEGTFPPSPPSTTMSPTRSRSRHPSTPPELRPSSASTGFKHSRTSDQDSSRTSSSSSLPTTAAPRALQHRSWSATSSEQWREPPRSSGRPAAVSRTQSYMTPNTMAVSNNMTIDTDADMQDLVMQHQSQHMRHKSGSAGQNAAGRSRRDFLMAASSALANYASRPEHGQPPRSRPPPISTASWSAGDGFGADALMSATNDMMTDDLPEVPFGEPDFIDDEEGTMMVFYMPRKGAKAAQAVR